MERSEITLTGIVQAQIQLTGQLVPKRDDEGIVYATEQDIVNIFKGETNHEQSNHTGKLENLFDGM